MGVNKYNHREIEKKLIKKWESMQLYKTPHIEQGDAKKYVLFAFAYPSGSGLHVGHCKPYTAVDIIARFYRLRGNKVLVPTGWDAFGLPAENFAIKNGIHPRISTDKAIAYYEEQVSRLGLSTDWEREIATHTPEYYQWTQWLFQLLYKKGLAYKKEALVNWDPVDQTVLANEQVLSDGTAERSGAKVEQKMMSQWFFKITDYAERLLSDLDGLDWPESTKTMQKNWIGRSEGAEVDFKIENGDEKITVFTTRIDTLFSGTFLLLAPEHSMIDSLTTPEQRHEIEAYKHYTASKSQLERTDLNKDKTAAFTGSYAINPANGERMPIWIADFVLASYGTGAVFADAHDERDFELAKKYHITLSTSIIPEDASLVDDVKHMKVCYSGYGILYNSDQFDGMHSKEAKNAITAWGESLGWARAKTTYRLRDWLVSRQRFWGSPIPIVYNKNGEEILVPESDLPVILPDDVEFTPTGRSPLIDHAGFHEEAEKLYGEGVKREVDTMDTFVCSSWYFFRFCSPRNDLAFSDPVEMKKWMPVDDYIIGAEHVTLHLLYARFFTKVLFDEGLIDFEEPFLKIRHQGMVGGEDGRKMSKRWGNVVNPVDIFDEYGADTLRMYEMFIGPLEDSGNWNTHSIKGVRRFLDKVWKLQDKVVTGDACDVHTEEKVESQLQTLIHKLNTDFDNYSFNTMVSEYMKCVNFIEECGCISVSQFVRFLVCLSPFAPFITEEIYLNLDVHLYPSKKESIHLESYPEYRPDKVMRIVEKLKVQINGKMRADIHYDGQATDEDIYAAAIEANKKWFENRKIVFKKIVPQKMVVFGIT